MRFDIDALFKVQDGIIADVAFAVLTSHEIHRATKYLSPQLVVRATRSHKYDKRDRQRSVVLTIGRPNYREHGFIKRVKQAGEPFPIKKIQLRLMKSRVK